MAASFSLSLLGILILCIFCSLSSKAIDVSAKCTHILTTASLKNQPRDNHTLRVLVPWRVGFEQFVNFRPESCWLDGFSIQVFLEALRHMQNPQPPPYKFVLHGSGDETPSYDVMIDMLVNKEVDVVVADLTITTDRMERVAFTVPYLASSLVMVTPFRYGSAGTLWDFLKPFSRELWMTLLGFFVFTGLALYLLEDQNPDFAIASKKREGESQGSSHGGSSTQRRATLAPNVIVTNSSPLPSPSPSSHSPPTHPPHVRGADHAPQPLQAPHNNPDNFPACDISSLQRLGPPIYEQASHKRRITNAYWFASLCVFQAQQESVRSHLGRIVTVMWLFVMLIFDSSYTASLASLLSAQKRYSTIEDFQALLRDESISVGYLQGSFMKNYTQKLKLDRHNLKNFASATDYARALREGNRKPGGVGAVLDELPYIQILLQSECDFTISSKDSDRLPSFGGFGFAFRKGDALIDQVSKMIVEMAEDGTLQTLKNGWNIGDDKRERCDLNAEPSHLRLRSFGGLFSIVGLVYIACTIWRLSTKAIKSPEGSCSPLIGRTGDLSLSRRSNKIHDESQDDQPLDS